MRLIIVLFFFKKKVENYRLGEEEGENGPREGAAVGLPPPELVAAIRAAVLLARQLRLYVRAVRFLVEGPSQLVPHPPPAEQVAPSPRRPPQRKRYRCGVLLLSVIFHLLI